VNISGVSGTDRTSKQEVSKNLLRVAKQVIMVGEKIIFFSYLSLQAGRG
jgi:hypothetical protein